MKKSCENCGNQKCKNMMVAVLYDACLKSDYEKFWQPQTNADRIRSLSDEKLAVVCEDGCPPGAPICNSVETIEGETVKEHCQRCWLNWLKAPAEEVQDET